MPRADIRPILEARFVLLATDCDEPEPEVRQIGVENLAGARTLPFVMYLDSSGRFLHGTSGGRSAAQFKADLEHALALALAGEEAPI